MAFDRVKTVTLTRTVQVELAKPLNASWEEAGGRLRVIRSQMHRLLNAGIVGLVANRYFDEQYRALEYIKEEIADIESWAQANNAAHLANIELPSVILDACQRRCVQMVQQWRGAKGEKRIPSFKRGAPILVRDGGWKLSQAERGFELAVKLHGGRDRPAVRFAVAMSKGWHWSMLRRMTDDETVKLGSAQVVYDERRKKWYAKLAVTATDPVPDGFVDGVVMALNRGRHCFLYAGTNIPGKQWALIDGREILETKRRFAAQRSGIKAHMRAPGAGARGHGKARWFEPYCAKEEKEKRFIRRICQEAAARAVKRALQVGARTVLIEDFNTIEDDNRFVSRWPWYQLKEAVRWACKKNGIELVEVPSECISSTCPRCENLDPAQHNTRTGMFHCAKCGFARSADLIATLNMLDHNDIDIGRWRKQFKEEQEFVQSIRTGQTDGLLQGQNASGPGAPGGKPPREHGSARKSRRKGAL